MCAVEGVCVACRAGATGRVGGGVRVRVREGNHQSSHQRGRHAAIFAITRRAGSHLAAPWRPTGHPAKRHWSESGFDSVPGGLGEQPHHTKHRPTFSLKVFVLLLFIMWTPYFSRVGHFLSSPVSCGLKIGEETVRNFSKHYWESDIRKSRVINSGVSEAAHCKNTKP